MTPSVAEHALAELYDSDETAWLEITARLVQEGRFGELDAAHLSEYLSDMARRDKREVLHRLVVLLAHLLKWEHQPDLRSASWQLTIDTQRDELNDLLESGSLRRHAEEVLAKAYARARHQAAGETGLDEEAFPAECPLTLDQVLVG